MGLKSGFYDAFLALGERRGMRSRRAELVGRAHGRVLEIGAGTGLNVEHYPDGLERLVLSEPDEGMAKGLRARAGGTPAEVVIAGADELPFPGGSFDTVVSTMVLCTVPDPGAAVAEIRRVLAPEGRLLFIEHVAAHSPRLSAWQRRLRAPWKVFAEGCECDRETVDLLERNMRLGSVTGARWRGMPPIVHPLVIGEARP